MKIIVNRDPATNGYEFSRFYPLADDSWTEKQAERTSGYGIRWNPFKNTIVISGLGDLSIEEIEKLAQGLLLGCQEARAIAQERGMEVG